MKKTVTLILPEEITEHQPLVLFDGKCNLCCGAVRFLIRYNKSANLSFASIQSDTGIKITALAGLTFNESDTLLFLDENILYAYSTAALKIASHLRFPWNLLGILGIIPHKLRDSVYQYIAGNRYRWFGKKPECMISDPKFADRFLG
jgi:predicted DCC family thiol-disulfide oxidoreductase YuxK